MFLCILCLLIIIPKIIDEDNIHAHNRNAYNFLLVLFVCSYIWIYIILIILFVIVQETTQI